VVTREDDPTIEALIRPSRPLNRVTARVIEGKGSGLFAELAPGQSVSIGKSPDNQLCLDDMTVSRYHVELTLRRGDIEVRDLESMNGTYIGETRIARAFVRAGVKLTVGSNTVLLTAEERSAPSHRPEPEEIPELPGVIADSPAMRKVVQTIWKLAGTTVTVLLHGETGTGKEVLARSLHDLSDRRNAPFEVVDCGSMAPTLLASELVGHDRGAFTGAHGEHAGAFERAHGGTVFLDEIGELPLDLQPMLLGVLERRRFKRVGGVKERRVDVRVIAATHRDLRDATNVGTFRADLYFRLAVARVVIPPLRERPEDIPALVRRFAEQLTGDPSIQPFDSQTLSALEAHPWSGNVRELRNVVESAVALGSIDLENDTTGTSSADPPPTAAGEERVLSDSVLSLPYREARARAVSAFERSYLRKLTEACGGNASEAARRAKMDRPYLLGLLRKHGLR
jgi:DNA-binding NtrC family response regulator